MWKHLGKRVGDWRRTACKWKCVETSQHAFNGITQSCIKIWPIQEYIFTVCCLMHVKRCHLSQVEQTITYPFCWKWMKNKPHLACYQKQNEITREQHPNEIFSILSDFTKVWALLITSQHFHAILQYIIFSFEIWIIFNSSGKLCTIIAKSFGFAFLCEHISVLLFLPDSVYQIDLNAPSSRNKSWINEWT